MFGADLKNALHFQVHRICSDAVCFYGQTSLYFGSIHHFAKFVK